MTPYIKNEDGTTCHQSGKAHIADLERELVEAKETATSAAMEHLGADLLRKRAERERDELQSKYDDARDIILKTSNDYCKAIRERDALREERDAARKMVKAAYKEGYADGYDQASDEDADPNMNEDAYWTYSDARKALGVDRG